MSKEYKSDVMEFTSNQIKAGKICAIVLLCLLAVFYVLVRAKVINVSFSAIIVGSLLGCVGLILLSSGLIQRNSVSIWLAFAFLVPAVVALLCSFGISQYSVLYPLYVAIPAISSFFTALVCGKWLSHAKVILVFVVSATCFVLNIINVIPFVASLLSCIGWALVVVAYVVYRITRRLNDNE